ncbi:MAG: hypothetical protein ABJQ29_09190 [Luteolibacter sp.]
MKPNAIVVQPSHVEFDEIIENFCEKLSDTHYVYLIRPFSEIRDDSPGGVRFLNHGLDRLPGFAEVGAAIAIGEAEIAAILGEAYPMSKCVVWDPRFGDPIPKTLMDMMNPVIVQGHFQQKKREDYASAG